MDKVESCQQSILLAKLVGRDVAPREHTIIRFARSFLLPSPSSWIEITYDHFRPLFAQSYALSGLQSTNGQQGPLLHLA